MQNYQLGQPALFSGPMHCSRLLNRVPNLIRHRLLLCSQEIPKEVTPLVRSLQLAPERKWGNTVDIRHYRFSERFSSISSASSDCRTPRSLSIYSEQRPDSNTDHCGLNKRSEQIQLSDRADSNGHQVVVGLSGGVDSSVAAAVLHKEGYDVIGVTLWHMKGEGSCCSGGMFDAGRICDQLGIEHRVVDTRDDFKANIIDYVVQGYQSGISPLPCSQCNKLVKFRGLLDAAEDIGVSKVATGHYARVDMDPETKRYRLRRAVDPVKDQAYFLFELSQDQLSRVVFPLGNQTKADTRRVAAELGLHTATKPESQDLCLVEAHGTMQNFLAQHIKPKTGNIVDPQGRVLGQHSGIHNFTVGQRKGLGVAADRPLYVISLDAEKNEVVVCKERSSGLRPDCTVRRVNWVSIARPDGPIRAQVQIRYRSPPVPATVVALDEPSLFGEPRARIIFDDPQFAVAPGQGAVFFDGDMVLGGGVIEAFPNPKPQPAATTTSSSDVSVSS